MVKPVLSGLFYYQNKYITAYIYLYKIKIFSILKLNYHLFFILNIILLALDFRHKSKNVQFI